MRKDNSDSFIPFLFSFKSVNAFALFKTKVLNACSASRTNVQLYYNHSDCKVTLSSATWESFVFFLKSRQDCTVTLLVETVSSAASAALRTPGLFSSQLSGASTISNVPQQNVKNVLDMIIEKDWSGVFIQALPKKSREEARDEVSSTYTYAAVGSDDNETSSPKQCGRCSNRDTNIALLLKT